MSPSSSAMSMSTDGAIPASTSPDPPVAAVAAVAAAIPPSVGGNDHVPKPKRLACIICRKRKLKCDVSKPSCSPCRRLGHTCAYDEVRRKSGPKRGYVKALEERLKQVEAMLRPPDGNLTPGPAKSTASRDAAARGSTPPAITVDAVAGQSVQRPLPQQSIPDIAAAPLSFSVSDPSISVAKSRDMDRWRFNGEEPTSASGLKEFDFNVDMNMALNPTENNFTWEMIGLGLEEPLPPQETIDELYQIYFEKIHPSLPMIHKFRYLAAMNLAPNQRPPVCLRYAMWTLAASASEKYQTLKDLFYRRTRKYLESDYTKGFGEHIISVAHAQTHILLTSFEYKWMYFPRAWMSTGAAVRLCQMMGLHRLDRPGLDVKQCLPSARDWTETEERRRTFWMAFCQDRYSSIGTGWPMTIDERDISTNLPASDDAFSSSCPEQTAPLNDVMNLDGASRLSSFGGVVLLACLFGRNLVHLHRPDADDRDDDLNGEFWKRHRSLDNILLNTSLSLPAHLKLPAGMSSPNVVFTNMCIHTSTICLHQAAIFKADTNLLSASVSAESKVRCITAASEIASIMRMISHLDLVTMNPFISFCLYVSARVFVQYLKSRPEDSQTGDSLRFLLSAMNALKRQNPLTESFLVQLDVDLEALVTRIPTLAAAFPRSGDTPLGSFMTGTAPSGATLKRAEQASDCMLGIAKPERVFELELGENQPQQQRQQNQKPNQPQASGSPASQPWSTMPSTSSHKSNSTPTISSSSLPARTGGSSYVPMNSFEFMDAADMSSLLPQPVSAIPPSTGYGLGHMSEIDSASSNNDPTTGTSPRDPAASNGQRSRSTASSVDHPPQPTLAAGFSRTSYLGFGAGVGQQGPELLGGHRSVNDGGGARGAGNNMFYSASSEWTGLLRPDGGRASSTAHNPPQGQPDQPQQRQAQAAGMALENLPEGVMRSLLSMNPMETPDLNMGWRGPS